MARTRPTADYIFDNATDDRGLSIRDKARFHAFNPHGVLASLPSDFSLPGDRWATGLDILFSRFTNYHAKAIQAIADGKRATRRDIDYHIQEARKDADRAKTRLAEKRAAKEEVS